MFDALRPYLARLISAAVAAGLAAIATKMGIDATSSDQVALAGSLGTFLTLVIYSVLHKLLDKKINPADAASSHLAAAGVTTSANLKASQADPRTTYQDHR